MRQAVAAIAALIVLGAVLFVANQALEERGDEAALDGPDATVDAYLAAWGDGDHDAMAELVRDPAATFTEVHEQLREGLGVDDLTVERTDLVEDVDGRATATAEVTAQVASLEPLTWPIELRLLRERGRWGVAWGPEALHPDWRPGLRFVTTTAPAQRAPILARDGTELAGPGERVTFGFEPGIVEDADEVVDAFEAAIPGSGATAERLLTQGGLVDGWFYPVTSLPAETASEIGRELTGVPGVLRRSEDGARNLLADGFAEHVVGRTGEATAEELERLGDPYEPGDHVGKTGLEQVLETRLAAREEIRVELRDGESGPVRSTLAVGAAPREGDATGDGTTGPVTTTLDVTVQRAVENTLLGRRGPAAVVVVDVSDGAVRAAASRPLDGFNRAFEGRYPPGTAFAPVVVDALVASGGDAGTTVACPPEDVVAGRRVSNATGADLDDGPLPEAVAAGCATSLAAVGRELGEEALSAAAGRFGADVAPIVPLFANGLSFPAPVDLGEAAVAAAGQGRVEVSPLHLATIAAGAATGRWWPAYLLEEDGPGEAVNLAPGALDALGRLLAAGDTAGAGLTGITGAASGPDGTVHSWFLGVVDDLAVAVLVEDAEQEAGDDAGPVGGEEGDDRDGAPDERLNGDRGVGEAGTLAARFARELEGLTQAPVDEDA